MNRDEALAILSPSSLRQEIVPIREAQFNNALEHVVFNVAGIDFVLGPDAYRTLASMCGIPGLYAEKTPMALMAPHFQYWFSEGTVKYSDIQLIVTSDNEVQAINRPNAPFYNPGQLLDWSTEIIGRESSFENVGFDITKCGYNISSGRNQAEVVKGDIVESGVSIQWSIADQIGLSVSPYNKRLVCTNGMVRTQHGFVASRRHDLGDTTRDWFRAAFERAWGQASEELSRFQELAAIRLDTGIEATLNDLFRRVRIPRQHQVPLAALAVEQLPSNPSMWDLTNVLTYYAQHRISADEYDSVLRLQSAAGDLVEDTICPVCHKFLSRSQIIDAE